MHEIEEYIHLSSKMMGTNDEHKWNFTAFAANNVQHQHYHECSQNKDEIILDCVRELVLGFELFFSETVCLPRQESLICSTSEVLYKNVP